MKKFAVAALIGVALLTLGVFSSQATAGDVVDHHHRTPTPTPCPTDTPVPVITATVTLTPTSLPTATATNTATVTPSPTNTPTPTNTATATPAPTDTPSPTAKPTAQLIAFKGAQVFRDAPPTPPPGEVRPGDHIVYTMLVTNTGQVDGLGISMTDAIPGGTTYLPGSAMTNGDALTVTVNGPITAVRNLLQSSQVFSLTFAVIVNNQPIGNQIENCVVVQAQNANPTNPPCVEHVVSLRLVVPVPKFFFYLPLMLANFG